MEKEAVLADKERVLFQKLAQDYALTEHQITQLQHYMSLVLDRNKGFNLTAINDATDFIDIHFRDSLALADSLNLNEHTAVIDVGTGAGFPGMALKICFPHLQTILIETNTKKIAFLQEVIDSLSLEDIQVVGYDWRTFLRKTNYSADLIVSRASLHTDELLRALRISCPYQHAMLIYWASQLWIAPPEEKKFIVKEYAYSIHNKKRRLIFFKKPKE